MSEEEQKEAGAPMEDFAFESMVRELVDLATATPEKLDEALATLGDDSQLMNLELQDTLQKLQQSLQMLSNISKMMHDTTMSIIRNFRA